MSVLASTPFTLCLAYYEYRASGYDRITTKNETTAVFLYLDKMFDRIHIFMRVSKDLERKDSDKSLFTSGCRRSVPLKSLIYYPAAVLLTSKS